VAALPELDRRALYTRTLENLAKACASPPEGLRDYCEGQARLAVEFAECDGKCQALAKPHLERIPRR
jgi:hypothetical protein